MNNAVRALSVSMILILSSLAGCLSDDETTVIPDENLDDLVINYGTVMVSTYHVGELVSAVAGDSVTVEYMSQDNIPVHDYEPSAADLIRLQEADIFFYHGLNLEPWVDSTLSSLGDDAPPSYMTHTMPSGESNLAYESMLVSDLCELMTDGPFESTTLGMMHDDHGDDDHDDHGDDDHDDHGDDDHDDHGDDDHDDHGDDDHDDHGDDDHDDHGDDDHDDHGDDDHDDHGDDDHDDHGDDDHDDHGDDDHDEHDDHEHAEAEMAFENPEACPADTSIQVFHMEEGEHILEFESEHDEDFNMAVLKMLGGHAHHDHHGHGSGPFEWAGIFEMNDATHTWSMQKVDGDYADPTMRLVLIPTDTPTEETMHGLESGVEALIEGDCTVVEDGETMTSIAAEGSCFELHVGTGDDSTFTIDTNGITGMSMYAQHVPTEFERDQHYLKDSAGTDIEPVAQEGAGAHGDHGDHGDEHGDDHDDHGDEMCHNAETHENYESTEEECEAAGHIWGGDEDHDDDHSDEMCHNAETHENYESTEEDCENSGDLWLGHEDHDLPEIHADLVAHTLSFPEEMVCYDMNTHTVNMSITTESDCQAAGLMWTAANSGPGGDDHSDEEEHHEIGALIIHIEAEGDYGFALPNDVAMYIVMGEGGHDDHDDHGDDDHDDHGDDDHDDHGDDDHDDHSDDDHDDHGDDDHDDHSDDDHDDHGDDDHDDHSDDDHDDHGDEDEIDAGEGDDAFTYDPHSWLSPIAFEAQLNFVLDSLSSTFPDGSELFTENAASYSSQLMDLHERFTAAFGVDGTCDMAGQDKTIVANHNAYSYMSVQYDIDIITLHGLDPEGEPSPADIAEVVESIEEKGITVLFVEEYTDQSAVNSIVEQTGVSLEILYTMEMAPSDSNDNYLSMMNKNLENIISGCGC